MGTPSATIAVSVPASVEWARVTSAIFVSVVGSAVAAILGGLAGTAADAAENTAQETATQAYQDALQEDANVANAVVEGVNPNQAENATQVAREDAQVAAQEVKDPSLAAQILGYMRRNVWKIVATLTAKAINMGVSHVLNVLQAEAQNDVRVLPTIGPFVESVMAPVTFAGQDMKVATSCALNGALQVGLTSATQSAR